jgi:hypothetical protein
MKIIYCHNREYETFLGHDGYTLDGRVSSRGGTTVAMEAIQSWLLDQLVQGSTIVRKVGIARCSKDDNYCKKTGREIARSRLKQKTLKVVNLVKIGPNYTVVFFEDEDKNLFEFRKSPDPYCAVLVRMLED